MVDFVCKRAKLVFEIDGDSHYSEEGIARDERRTAFLAGLGYRVVRFSNADVLGNAEGMFEVLRGILGEPARGPTSLGRTPTAISGIALMAFSPKITPLA